MKRLLSIIAILVLLVVACAPRIQLTPEQLAARQDVLSRPTEFSVPKEFISDVWARGQVWIAKHGNMKLQIMTDNVIQTYNPIAIGDFGYYVTKTPATNAAFIVSVECSPYVGNIFYSGSKEANLNAHKLAHFMASGEDVL